MSNNWKKYTIGDICSTISVSYKGHHDKVVLVNTSDVFDGELLVSDYDLIDNSNLKGQFKKTFLKNDILFSEIRPANRRFAFVELEKTDYYIASTKLMVIRANEKIVSPKYLFYLLTSRRIITELQHLAETRSGTFPQITFKGEMAPLVVDIPDLKTQESIVEALSVIDKKIKINSLITNNLKDQLKYKFEELFLNSNEDWTLSKIGDYLDIQRGLSYKGAFLSETEGVPMLNLGNIMPNSTFRPEKLKFYTGDYKEKHTVKAGDIILANTDLTQAREVLGSAILVPELEYQTMIFSHHLSIVKDYSISKNFIMGLFNSSSFRKRVAGFATGTTVLALPSEAILNCEFRVPPQELISSYDGFASPMYDLMELLRIESNHLFDLKQTLVPKLLSGEIRL